MALQHTENFDVATTLTDAHDIVQSIAGNATWFSQFVPVVQSPRRNIAEAMLRLFQQLGLSCAIVGKFAMYVGGLLTSCPELITMYMAYHPEMLSPDLSILLQIQPTPVFSLDELDFLFVPSFSILERSICYTVRCGVEHMALRIVCVNSLQPFGPRTNLDLTSIAWTTFSYYCANYAMVVLPLQTSGDRILYFHHYRAEIRGEDSRTYRSCLWDFEDPRRIYFGCQKPNRCTCILCCKQPLSLKTAASKIVWGF